jgi:hypothetical protein
MIVLALSWYNNPKELAEVLNYVNFGFALIFTAEAILKIFAFGKVYFEDGWNNFDFFVVCGTIGGIIVQYFTNVGVGPSTTVIRAFRIGRVFRLVKKAKSLKLIFTTFIITIPSLANIGSLLLLLIYLYSVLGVFMFADLKLQENLN